MSRPGTLRPHPDVISQNFGDQTVLVHLQTNRIYELNRTASRLWELVCAGHAPVEIQRQMCEEFEVTEDRMIQELDELLASLRRDQLLASDSA